jgi:plasmid replication initiation protein
MFSWIEHADLERDDAGNVASAVVVIPEWLFEAVSNKGLILTLHDDYSLLTGALERWLYKFIRKGAGKSPNGWKWTLRALHRRSGVVRQFKYFARDIRGLIERGTLLDYRLSAVELNGEDSLHAWAMAPHQLEAVQPESVQSSELRLKSNTYDLARAAAPGYDVHGLEADWRRACERDGVPVRNPDAAYLGWCRAVHKKRPLRA